MKFQQSSWLGHVLQEAVSREDLHQGGKNVSYDSVISLILIGFNWIRWKRNGWLYSDRISWTTWSHCSRLKSVEKIGENHTNSFAIMLNKWKRMYT